MIMDFHELNKNDNRTFTNAIKSDRIKVWELKRDSGDDLVWITINDIPILIKNGELQGKIGKKNEATNCVHMINNESLIKLNNVVENLQREGLLNPSIGILRTSEPITIMSISSHAKQQLEERNITIQQAQSYIDNSSVMFEQGGGDKRLYISKEGNAAVLVEGEKLLTAYPASYFDKGMVKFVKEVKKYE